MLSRQHRFHGHASLRYVYQKGSTVRGPLFAVRSVLNPRRQHYRLAVVISRKVSKSAIKRNRIRRRLYEIVRQLGPAISQPYDIVITVYHETAWDEPPASLASQVKKQLEEAGVIGRRPE
jgi:ribonuclease P protein component